MDCRTSSCLALFVAVAAGLVSPDAKADAWKNVTDSALGVSTGGWTNKCDLADVNGDGHIDLLFANGSAYDVPGDQEMNGLWLWVENDADGSPVYQDVSEDVFTDGDFSRVMKGRDLDGDGNVDLIVGNTYGTQSRLYLGLGGGEFEERTDLLPELDASIGDLEIGDIDGDGDLDLVLADWGLENPGGSDEQDNPFTARGGQMLVWRNDGDGFVDVTADVMPADVRVAWSWEMELIDVDGDLDLDVLASCKSCEGSTLLRNERGRFTHDAADVPAFTNNYDFEPMFLDLPSGERALAVVTINDGTQNDLSNRFDLRERLFVAGDNGRFSDQTAELWPDEHNIGADDNMVVVLDFDSDGDPDFLIGALGGGDDRLHINHLDEDGTFHLDANDGIQTGLTNTPGTLGIATGDLNGDGKLDVVQSQGELADPEAVWIGDDIAADSAAPIIESVDVVREDGRAVVLSRVHDNKSPSRAHDWKSVSVRWTVDGEEVDGGQMRWTGEFYWRAELEVAEGAEVSAVICATDSAGNETCSEADGKTDDAAQDDEDDASASSGGCRTGGPAPYAALFSLLLLGLRRRRA